MGQRRGFLGLLDLKEAGDRNRTKKMRKQKRKINRWRRLNEKYVKMCPLGKKRTMRKRREPVRYRKPPLKLLVEYFLLSSSLLFVILK